MEKKKRKWSLFVVVDTFLFLFTSTILLLLSLRPKGAWSRLGISISILCHAKCIRIYIYQPTQVIFLGQKKWHRTETFACLSLWCCFLFEAFNILFEWHRLSSTNFNLLSNVGNWSYCRAMAKVAIMVPAVCNYYYTTTTT